MHIFVINLEKDVARRESISAQLDTLGLPFEIVPGVYGASLTEQQRAQVYDDRKAKLHRARSLVSAEIGCALSHLKVYRAIVDRGLDAALILEDDVILPNDLKEFLYKCTSYLEASMPSVWLLSPAEGKANASSSLQISALHRLLPYRSGYYTSSYLLTRAAASTLLRELEPVSDVADCWQRLNHYKVVDLYVISPPIIDQQQEEFGSSTTADINAAAKNRLINILIYKVRRMISIAYDLIYAPYRRCLKPYVGISYKAKENI